MLTSPSRASRLPHAVPRPGVLLQSCGDGSCGTDGGGDADPGVAPFVYAIGSIAIRFPSLGVEKELLQATGRLDSRGLTDQQTLQAVLAAPENRYLSRQVCWVFTIEGLDTYLLQPRETTDLDLLLESVRTNPRADDVDVVIGVRGPLAHPSVCNGLTVPMVTFSQLYTFDRKSFQEAIPVPKGTDDGVFRSSVDEVFDAFLRVADNAGATDEHRAINYLATRYAGIYERAARQFAEGFALTAVETAPSRLSGMRRLVNVSLVFTDRRTQLVERYSARVDVTEEFPFLAAPLAPTPYVER